MTAGPGRTSIGPGRASQGASYDEVASILERHDPMGVMQADVDGELGPLDEYDPEATAILARLGAATSPDDVERTVRDVFIEWFGEEPPGLDAVAAEMWALIESGRRAT